MPTRNRLILVEGIVDAVRVRELGEWVAPCFSMNPPAPFLSDVETAHREGIIDSVVVWFDAENRAELRSKHVARTLRYHYGIDNVSVLTWPMNDKSDQGDQSKSELLNLLIGGRFEHI